MSSEDLSGQVILRELLGQIPIRRFESLNSWTRVTCLF